MTQPAGTNSQVRQSGTTADLIDHCDYQVYVVRKPNNLNQSYELLDYEEMSIDNVVSIEIRESMDMLFRTGTLSLTNRSSFRELFPLTGNEIVTIVYKNHLHISNSELKRKIIHFQIFHIDEIDNQRERSGNQGSTFINLHLVEFPMYHFLTSECIHKSWPIYTTASEGKKASEYFTETMRTIPNFENHYELQIEESYEDLKLHNMWIPGWTPFKIIKYFNKFMSNKNKQGYYFFNTLSNNKGKGNKPIAAYRSIYSLFDTEHFKTYSTTQSDTSQRQPTSENDKKLLKKSPEDDKHFSPTSYITSKKLAYGNSNKFFDAGLNSRTGLIYDYNTGNNHLIQTYRNFMKNYKSLGMSMPFSENAEIGGNQWSSYEAFPFNNIEMTKSYLNNSFYDNVFKQMFLTAMCPVDETRFLGEKASIYLPSTSKDRMIDFQMSGRWIVWKIVDVITSSGISTSEVTFVRDSFWIQNGDYLEKSKNIYQDEISSVNQRK